MSSPAPGLLGAIAMLGLALTLGMVSSATAQIGSFSDVSPRASRPAPPRTTVLAADAPLLAGPIDADEYRVGPGDVLNLIVPGVIQGEATLVVDAEGGVILPGSSGRVQLAGRTLNEARNAVADALSLLARDRSFALSLERPRRFKVYVTGNVATPGAVETSAVARVSEAIALAGGVVPPGSRRQIRLRRASGEESMVDLDRFALIGDLERNPLVDGGDVIEVPVRQANYGFFGGVGRPGTYELVPGETMESALALAGGPLPGARLEAVELTRFEPSAETPMRTTLNLNVAGDRSRVLAGGDAVVVPRPGEFQMIHTVDVSGEVVFPGRYPIEPGIDTVADVMLRAGGFTENANRGGARLFRRVLPEADAEQQQAPGSVSTLEASRPPKTKTQNEMGVDLSPRFAELPPTAREEELSSLGPTGREIPVAWTEQPFAESAMLAGGDRMVVPRTQGTVRVDGRVRSPGLVPFSPGRELDDYVLLAGGYDKNADRDRVYVQRAGREGFEHAEGAGPIADGDAIWVAEKTPRGAWTWAREIITVAAAVATVVYIIGDVSRGP